jgi:Na+/melibiose symporter-like transporter
MTSGEATCFAIGGTLLGLALFTVFTAGFEGQNGTDPGEEQVVMYMLVVAAALCVVGIALVLGAAGSRRRRLSRDR